MYCSSCGTAVTPGLRYCNRCGAGLKAKQDSPSRLSETSLQSLVWAIASVTIVGLGGVIGLMALMKEVLHFNDELIVIFSLLGFLSFMGVDLVFIWVLLRSRKYEKEADGRAEIDEAKKPLLAEPAVSVTEHTTRTLETADMQQKAE